jgi:hypothetical protein
VAGEHDDGEGADQESHETSSSSMKWTLRQK